MMCVCASMNPGSSVACPRSTTRAPAGTVTDGCGAHRRDLVVRHDDDRVGDRCRAGAVEHPRGTQHDHDGCRGGRIGAAFCALAHCAHAGAPAMTVRQAASRQRTREAHARRRARGASTGWAMHGDTGLRRSRRTRGAVDRRRDGGSEIWPAAAILRAMHAAGTRRRKTRGGGVSSAAKPLRLRAIQPGTSQRRDAVRPLLCPSWSQIAASPSRAPGVACRGPGTGILAVVLASRDRAPRRRPPRLDRHPHPPPRRPRGAPDGPIVIDGRLDEPAWAAATPITTFTQVQPVDGAPGDAAHGGAIPLRCGRHLHRRADVRLARARAACGPADPPRSAARSRQRRCRRSSRPTS